MTVYGSLQCPYYVHAARSPRCSACPTGRCASCRPKPAAASAARRSTRRCSPATRRCWHARPGGRSRWSTTASEDMLATTKRHPSIVRHRTGVGRDGRLLAMEIDVAARRRRLHDPLRPVVLSRGDDPRHRPVPLRPRARARPRRGHQHAAERRLPRLRRAADPVRRRGAHGPHRRGARHRPGRAAREERPAPRRHHRDRPGDRERPTAGAARPVPARARLERRAPSFVTASAPRGTGIGLALFCHGSGFTGGGEVWLRLEGGTRATPGRVRGCWSPRPRSARARAPCSRRSPPTRSACPTRRSRSQRPDTARGARQRPDRRLAHLHDRRPDPAALRRGDAPAPRRGSRPPSTCSATARWSSPAVRAAAGDQLGRRDLPGRRLRRLRLGLRRGRARGRPRHLRGAAPRITAVCDLGRAIHPQMVAGQIEGGVAQGVGLALLEQVTTKRRARWPTPRSPTT